MSTLPRISLLAAALAAVASLAVPATASADVQLTISEGRVSLKATNATIRDILAEWAKVGQARIVNAERLTGAPVTMELTNVTEGQALDVILRTVAGYMAAPRPTPVPGGSQFDRILILPTSTPPPRPAATPPPAAFPQPQFTLPQPDDDDDQPRVPTPGPRGPIFNTFPQPGQQPAGVPPNFPVNPNTTPTGAPPNFPFNQQPPARGNAPNTAPAPGGQVPQGVSVPGMIVPQQPPPGQVPPQ